MSGEGGGGGSGVVGGRDGGGGGGRWGGGGGGGGQGGGDGIFWSNTSNLLATGSEASTSGCHGFGELGLKKCVGDGGRCDF